MFFRGRQPACRREARPARFIQLNNVEPTGLRPGPTRGMESPRKEGAERRRPVATAWPGAAAFLPPTVWKQSKATQVALPRRQECRRSTEPSFRNVDFRGQISPGQKPLAREERRGVHGVVSLTLRRAAETLVGDEGERRRGVEACENIPLVTASRGDGENRPM